MRVVEKNWCVLFSLIVLLFVAIVLDIALVFSVAIDMDMRIGTGEINWRKEEGKHTADYFSSKDVKVL